MKKPLNILGVLANVEKAQGCEAYRLMYPLRALEFLGCKSSVLKGNDLVSMFKKNKNPLYGVDVVLFQRLIVKNEEDKKSMQAFTKAFRAAGIAIVVDYDDDYTNQHMKVTDGVLPDLTQYSMVSVSTPELAELMKPYASKIAVQPNGIVPELFDTKRFKRLIPELTIGLTGSESHKEDWKPAVQAIKSILSERQDITVFVSGYVPEELKGISGVRTLREFVSGANQDNFFIDLNGYGGIHANIDILLCPVDPQNKFNYYKSNLKSIEGMASARSVAGKTGGSCVIATGGALPIYKNSVLHEKTGLLVDDHANPEAWKREILKVVNNVELRNKLQTAGYQHCMKQFTVHKFAEERLATYQRLAYKAKRDSSKYMTELALLEKIT
jgi:glycosyltransferase involved in cell wall biosynthesis